MMKSLLVLFLFVHNDFVKFGKAVDNISKIMSHANWALLNNNECGLSNTDRIIGGKTAALGQYPWLARVGYRSTRKDRKNRIYFRCGGAVINNRYILTAAHCVTSLPPRMLIDRIRLGEYDAQTNPDCDGYTCADPYQDFEIEEIKYHETYDKPVRLRNDIALVRVGQPIKFSDYIKPICMVRGRLLTKDFTSKKAEVAGWGITDLKHPAMSPILQTVKLPIVDNNMCVEGYGSLAEIGPGQICVGGIIGRDSCSGDSGGPLMKVEVADTEAPRYYVLGIVSFGSRLCGKTTLPGVYTRVSEYVSWILDRIRP